jgi:retinol-binding protein 3
MLAERMKRGLSDPYNWTKGIVFVALAYLLLVVILPAISSMLSEVHTAGSLDVTPTMRAQVVEALAEKISRRYVDAEKAVQIAAALRQAERNGEYDDITSPSQFGRLLTSELAGSSQDQHIRVIFSPGAVPDYGDRNFPPPYKNELSPLAWLIDRLGRYMENFGVEEVTQSDAGIGYLRLTGFVPPHLSGEKYASAMDRLADSRALIIDLRDNGGGSRDSVALLASYFFDQPTHLSEVIAPRTGERLQMWTRKDIEGRHYGSTRAVYILTSHATFSAGEDFAYAMQTRKRAIIVGEVTRGGAHPVAPFRLSTHFVAQIPVAETTSPLTHTNWEGVGVQPDIVVPAQYARKVATSAILKKQLLMENDVTRRAEIQGWLRAEQY